MGNLNPYAFDTNADSPDTIYVLEDLCIRQVSIKPLDLLSRSFALIKEQYWLFLAIVLVGWILGVSGPFAGILLGPYKVGMHLAFIQREQGQKAAFSTVLKGFNYFVDSFIAILIIVAVLTFMIASLILLMIFLPMMVDAMSLWPDQDMSWSVAPFVLGGTILSIIIVAIPFLFAFPLIADRKLSGGQAVWISLQGAKYNFGGICWFMFVMMILSMICASLFYLPFILFMPIFFGAQFLLYRDIFGPHPMDHAGMESSGHE